MEGRKIGHRAPGCLILSLTIFQEQYSEVGLPNEGESGRWIILRKQAIGFTTVSLPREQQGLLLIAQQLFFVNWTSSSHRGLDNIYSPMSDVYLYLPMSLYK